ncbi:hypothetical protein [Streptomyces sp. NPDC047829]|uniref:hypothetical protein n=1 Tax=Streptomyces sp. NPDC047829 TaxID=3154609 RepID=UPI0033C850E6
MPRGRHRHSPPLHRLLPPSAIAGVSLVCALGPWVFSEAMILRSLAAAAAVTAVAGAVVMRHWDAQAGRRVADLTRARASDEWRYEERVAELESDLEESRELRVKLEHRLRAKRTELAGLRNEHAALLRRYATAETERASALEGRRLLEIEAVPPARALPAARTASAEEATAGGAQATAGGAQASAGGAQASAGGGPVEGEAPAGGTPVGEGEEAAKEAPAVFSPEGSRLFLRANAALARLDEDAPTAPDAADRDGDGDSEDGGGDDGDGGGNGGGERAAAAESAPADEAPGQPAAGGHERTAAASPTPRPGRPEQAQEPERPEEQTDERPERNERPEQSGDRGEQSERPEERKQRSEQPGERPDEPSAQPRQATRQASGHFTVPTAVAVVPTAPVRRPVVEGGFDFFGTQDTQDTQDTENARDTEDGRAPSDTLEAVQNEDLADVVGQEALALHKAEAEAAFKPAGEESRGVGQVIDLTAHDETEQIDVQGLRSAVS